MKKIFYILVSAIVALGAVACNNEIDENIEANNGGGVSFTVALDDEASRIIIGERDAENKHTISFVEGDVIYAENGSLKPFEFVCDKDNTTFYCNEPNADGKLPAEMVGQKLNFYTNKVAQAWKGANGINLKANGVTFNNNGDVITLSLGSPVLAFTSPYDVVLKMSRPAFLTESNQYVEEMSFAAQEGTTYVPFLDAGLVTFSYSINGETIKTIEKDFETKVYNIGNLTLAVAQVNGVNYTELSKAIEKVEDGGTVVLAADYIVDDTTIGNAISISEGKSFTLDLNGQEVIAGTNNSALRININNDGVTEPVVINVTNGTITANSSAYCALIAAGKSEDVTLTVNLSDVTLNGGNSNGSVAKVFPYAIVNFNNGTVVAGADSYLAVESYGEVNIYDGVVLEQKGTSSYNGGLVGVGHYGAGYPAGVANIYGGKGVGAKCGFIAMTSGGVINAMGGEWTANTDGTIPANSGDSNLNVLVAQNHKTSIGEYVTPSIINVTGGIYKGGLSATAYDTESKAELNISAGSFNADPSAFINQNIYKAALNEESKLYDVVKKVPVAGIEGSDMQYETLAEAFEAAEAGQTVNVLAGTYTSFPANKLEAGVTVVCAEGTVFTPTANAFSLNVNGATVRGATFSGAAANDRLVSGTIDGHFEDCHFIATGFEGLRYCYAPNAGKTTTFIRCIFEGKVCYAVHFDGGYGGDLFFDECEFYGFNAFGKGVNKLTIKNSKFGYIDNAYKYNCANLWGSTTMENVELDFGHDGVTERISPVSESCTYVMNGVRINGESITYAFLDCSPVSVTINDVLYQGIAEGVTLVDGVYEISKPAGMTWFSKEINVNKNTFAGKTVKVVADIDMNGVEYLGGSIASYPSYCFAGTFDGGNKTISNLTISVEGDSYGAAALIPTIAYNAVIKDVKLKDVNISSSHYAAGIFGYMSTGAGSTIYEATVTNCHVDGGTITGNYYNGDNADKIGGIGGIFYNGEVSGCSVKNVTLSGYRDVAGIVGWANDEDAVVKNNTIENVTINVNLDKAYKDYVVRADHDVNNYVGEGAAATIEGNSGEATINWNGVPEYIAQVKGQNFKTVQAAIDVAEDGDEIKLAAGTYNFGNLTYGPANKLSFVGDDKEKTIVNMNKSLYLQGKSVKFSNLTYGAPAGLGYTEQAFAFIHHADNFDFDNCIINRLRVNVNSAKITNSTFEVITNGGFDGYGLYYYGNDGSKVVVENSVFNTAGKAICVYSEHAREYNLEVNNTKFYAGASYYGTSDKAAISIHSEYGIYGKLIVNGSSATGFANYNGGLWREVNNNTGTDNFNFTKIIDGAEYVADGVWKTAEGNYTLASKAAMFWFANEVNANGNTFAGKTVTVAENIDLNNEAWVPVGNKGTTQFEGTFDGGDKTISNLNIVDLNNTAGHAVGMFGQIHNAAAQIKNIKIAGVHVEGLHYVAPIVGYLSGGSDITNCHVDGATIIAYSYLPDSNTEFNGDKLGGIAGYAEDGSVVSQCSVKNTTITGYRDMGGIVGACVATAKVIDNTIGANVKIVVDNSNNYKPLTLQSEYNIASYVGKPANGAVVSGNGEVVIEWGDIRARGYRVYVTAQPKSAAAEWSNVFVHTWNAGASTEWCGLEVTANTEVINGYTYNYYEYPVEWDGTNVSIVVNNSNQQTADIALGTLDKDYYVVYSTAMHEVYTTAPAAGSIPEYVAPAEDTVLYLVPNANWNIDNARFAAYFFGNGETWVSMTENGDGVYEVVVPEGYNNVIFCRMNPSATTNNWDNKWNQTADLTVPSDDKVKFVVPDGWWDGADNSNWTTL